MGWFERSWLIMFTIKRIILNTSIIMVILGVSNPFLISRLAPMNFKTGKIILAFFVEAQITCHYVTVNKCCFRKGKNFCLNVCRDLIFIFHFSTKQRSENISNYTIDWWSDFILLSITIPSKHLLWHNLWSIVRQVAPFESWACN